jgi:hypothetical protein
MAGRGNPSFMKNQKARKRQEKAAAKRAARQARRDERASRGPGEGAPVDDALRRELLGVPEDEDAAEAAEGSESDEDSDDEEASA